MGIRSDHLTDRIPGNHIDKREFRHFARMGDDGSVDIVIATAEGEHVAQAFDRGEDPIDGKVYIEVTDLWPHDFTNVKVPAQAVANRNFGVMHASLKAQNKGRGKDRG